MFRGMYSAATGMVIASQSNEVTADNIAHVGVAGFRQRGVVNETFDRFLQQATGAPTPGLLGAQVARGFTDFRKGGLEVTGAPFDLALAGEGFFTLQGPNGPVYSRDGVLQRNAVGQLVNTGGLPILGQRGPITIPPQATNIVVGADGNVVADGILLDRLQLANFTNPSQLIPVGDALFQDNGAAGQVASTAIVQQGIREHSNVQLPAAMVSLIRELRYFDASQRALRSISETTQLLTRP
jgi:flagellar basal body rod protein FlgG